MRKFLLTAVVCLLIFGTINAQFFDDFSDGNLTENPTWEGDISSFEVNDEELQLNAPVSTSGTVSIFTPISLPDSAIWEIYTRLEFDPSGSNALRIFLQTDNQNIDAANGYFIEIGETGSEDNLKFYRLDAGTEELIAEGTTAAVARSPEFRLRITRKATGDWTVETDYAGGQNFQTDFQFFDPTHLGGTGWFGLECKYTSGRIDQFFFDNISVQPILADVDAPILLSAKAIDEVTVEATFNELLDQASAENIANYSLSPSLGMPMNVTQATTPSNTIVLTFSTPLQSLETYTLTATNVADKAGNAASAQTAIFDFLKVESPERFDLLINEIMADPTPAVGLPDAEWIEIYNRSDKTISLEGMTFSDNGAAQNLPDSILLPGEYVILCDDSAAGDLASFGKTIALSSFPGLSNEGEVLNLKNADGMVIHAVDFDDNWYRDPGKEDGGFTLELINPLTPCVGVENWIDSQNLNGGTPGRVNSVLDESPDVTFPDLLEVFPESPTELLLTFSEGLDVNSVLDVSVFQITPSINVQIAIPQLPIFNQVYLLLDAPLDVGEPYNIRVGSAVTDCSGNAIGMFDNLDFALPGTIEPGDLKINEILFNPDVGGVDFLEIYNASGKILNLADLLIGNVRDGDTRVFGVTKRQLLFPGELAAFTEDRQDILSRYEVESPSLLIENDLPSFPNEEGNAKLFIPGLINPQIIDDLNYFSDWHHPLLDDEDGVSLERIDPTAETDNPNNWTSAAESAGWATPTGMNSQFKNTAASVENTFELSSETFTPNDDGIEDFLLINYELGTTGFVANTTIFDAAGRPLKTLSQSELLSIEGFLRWDGDTDAGEPAKSGIYVIYIQMFNPQGEVQAFKLPCVLERG